MPDTTISIKDMHDYGYTYDEMLPLSKDTAKKYLDKLTIYRLFSDNTEAEVIDDEDFENHDGLFGIERDDWKYYLKHKLHA